MQTEALGAMSIQIANELKLSEKRVLAAIQLLQEKNTVPFIARYRKEMTQNLDEIQIREIQERLHYLQEFQERLDSVIHSIKTQGKLSDDLLKQLKKCRTKTELEDIYLPYKPKRRTRAMIAREKGLEPLAFLVLQQPLDTFPEREAQKYVLDEKGIKDVEEALSGASDIVAEIISENVSVRKMVRDTFSHQGVLISKVVKDKKEIPSKFEMYYDYSESIKKIPSHRYLAIRRGEIEGFLGFHFEIPNETLFQHILVSLKGNPKSPFFPLLNSALRDGYKRLIEPSVETDIREDLKNSSDIAASSVFADNLRHLLLSPALGGRKVIGIDPGLRTGSKCVFVDEIGKYIDTTILYLCQGDGSIQKSKQALLSFILQYQPSAIGIGNGTGGRETEIFVRKVLSEASLNEIMVVSVSESGASVYSASEIAIQEFPDIDLTIRGAISIARRLQDPLAELVKVDPKSIGVGQYQHDIHQPLLQSKLSEVVESCVNHVGVELNTASTSLLAHVAGIGQSLANKIVNYREKHGAFTSRKQLLKVPGLGPRAFEQAAGFLRIRNGTHPLDASAVHPERYALVESIAKDLDISVSSLMENKELIEKIDQKKYYSEDVGLITMQDILEELKKPGRDPRASFERPKFNDSVTTIQDLQVGMRLEGVVTNVTAFGAFVDIGVHQDGLIHLSELSDRFIKDAREEVQVGSKVTVEVLQVDIERKRISLSARIRKALPTPKKNEISSKQSSFVNEPFASL